MPHHFHREITKGEIAGRVMQSAKVNIVFDQFLIKEPETDEPTVWH
tara:strand:- start:797 stop:934 length:138 start_codon:yes stop_codon:yes gene_type:complete